MLSRRHIRNKVFQTVYNLKYNTTENVGASEKRYINLTQDFYKGYYFVLYWIIRIAKYSVQKAEFVASKHIKETKDNLVNNKLAFNPIVISLLENVEFQNITKKHNFDKKIESDDVLKIFNKLLTKEKYLDYNKNEHLNFEDHKKILVYIFNKVMLKSDLFKSKFEDEFINWQDDKALVYQSLNEKLRKLVDGKNHFKNLEANIKNDTLNFGIQLVSRFVVNYKELNEIIFPHLKNWDVERLTVVDQLLLNLAVCEFLYFENIPLKVTLNEYIEISKIYSTPNSKDFLNGVLDNVMNDLKQSGKIKKTGRGLIEV